jgi:hypothetical protein
MIASDLLSDRFRRRHRATSGSTALVTAQHINTALVTAAHINTALVTAVAR